MQTIKPFIDLGFHTVPLSGKLERLADGKKTTPLFQKDWKQHYQEHFNENESVLGGTLTGSISGIIAVDCDNANTTAIFMALDPAHPFAFVSRGKEGTTLIYKYHKDLADCFKIANGDIQLDFYSDEGFVYLPTDANTTKEPWPANTMEEMPRIPEVPPAVLALLKQFYISTHKPADTGETTPAPVVTANYLNPQVTQFLVKKSFIPGLFRIITPKAFRDLEQYTKFGYLHPENVPDGRGSEYLSKISAILGRDSSIDEDTFSRAMYLINDMWPDPMPRRRLEDTVINPMVSGGATIDGKPIWHFDPHWSTHGLTISSKRGESLEVFFDDYRHIYYLTDLLNGRVSEFSRDAELMSYMETVSTDCPPRKEIKPSLPLINVTSCPSKPFGFYEVDEYTRGFNRFSRTRALEILSAPETHAKSYVYPAATINYLRTLVPDNYMRNYLVRFLKRKLLTFEYSPTVLYFLGKPGSGKDTFVSLLAGIIGSANIARPTTKEFLEMYNGWMLDKYFVQLDEYGDQLSRQTDKDEALGKIKAYTGKQEVQIRQMRTDGFNYQHNVTFILTANRNPLPVDADDRRIALFSTPNVLSTQEWVNEMGGISTLIDTLVKEVPDFCYYLATQVDMLTRDEYTKPPESEEKHKLIATMLPAASRLVHYFTHNMWAELEEAVGGCDHRGITEGWDEGKVYEDKLVSLYLHMTDGSGTKRGLSKIFSDAGVKKLPSTKGGDKIFYYYFPQLKGFQVSPFEAVEVNVL